MSPADRVRSAPIYRRFGGISLGPSAGKSFESTKYDFPHIRDYLLERGVTTDVSETSTVWSNILPLYHAAIRAIRDGVLGERGRTLGRLPYQSHLSLRRESLFHIWFHAEAWDTKWNSI